MWKIVYFGVSIPFYVFLLLWTLLPLAQHEIDRTTRFWIAWGIGEVALVAAVAFLITIYKKVR